jgi:hypothetical protein
MSLDLGKMYPPQPLPAITARNQDTLKNTPNNAIVWRQTIAKKPQ